jgi:hypothetical protein
LATRAIFPGIKLPGREFDHSPPSEEWWSYTSSSPHFMAWCLINEAQENLSIHFKEIPEVVLAVKV